MAEAQQLSPVQKALLITGFLLTGSINTMTKKWQFQSCGPTTYSVSDDDQKHCQSGWKQFHKPWTQNIQMFIGESLVLGIFIARASGRRREAREAVEAGQQPQRRAPFYIFLLPACCDILATGVGGVGMLYITASVWQMMRGSLIIFTSFLSVVFLKKKLPIYNWIAVFVCAIGLALIGLSAVLDESDSGGSSNVPFGILLTCGAQFFAATQMVVEEMFVKGRNAPPEQVVGSEGVWGVTLMCVILFAMYWVPGKDAGSYENVVDSVHMLFGSRELLIFVGFYLISISFFNFFGVTMAGKLSAVHRTINDALRTIIIWTVEIFVYYVISEDFGTQWQAHTYLQIIGFAILIFGNFLKNAIIKIPCLSHEYEEDQPKTTTNSTVVSNQNNISLMAQDGQDSST